MKKYIIPAMEIAWFKLENIITASGEFAAKTIGELQKAEGAVKLDGENSIAVSQIISFAF